MEKSSQYSKERDIKAIVILLATQGLIHLGEIPDPISTMKKVNIEGSRMYIDLLEELQRKTQGNLTAGEEKFLQDILQNIRKMYKKIAGDQ